MGCLLFQVNTMESEYTELKKAVAHEEDLLKRITKENEDLANEIDHLQAIIKKA